MRSIRNRISTLGLVGSDASYFRRGRLKVGDLLSSLPDSEHAEDEHGFPDALLFSFSDPRDPGTVAHAYVVNAPTGVPTNKLELPGWLVVHSVDQDDVGLGTGVYPLEGHPEYLGVFRGTDGTDLKDWLQNTGLSVQAWNLHRTKIFNEFLFEPDQEGQLPAADIVHFAGRSLVRGLPQYAAPISLRGPNRFPCEPS